MITGLLGKKVGMTRIFTEDGRWIEVTVLEAGPCSVVQRKTVETDGYSAVQLGFGDIKESRCKKPAAGHFAKVGVSPKRTLKEVRVPDDADVKAGDEIAVKAKSRDIVPVQGALEARTRPALADWLALDEKARVGRLVREPTRADIPLAARCLERGALAIKPNGEIFTEDSIGMALANRELMRGLRDSGQITGGPKPVSKSDRSEFLHRLEAAVQAAKRRS